MSPPYNFTVLRGNGSELINKALSKRSWWRETPEGASFHFFWASNGQAFEGIDFHNWRGAPPGQRQLINRIKGNGGITNKDRLCVNLRRHSKAAKLDPSTPLVPLSFVITPAGENELKADHELISFREAAAAAKKRGENMWIVKPAVLNRGRGIQVFGSASKVEAFLRTKKPNNQWVVQKYIEKPLLVGGRKFDIRLLVLATSDLCGHERQLYMYKDSYVRTSSIVYEPTGDNNADRCMHLVNDAVQSTFESYGTYEDANKLSLPELQAIFDSQPPLDSGRILSIQNDVWPAMKATVQQVFSCASQLFTPAPPGGGMFELFGLDFMIDATGRALLIEVNTQPALGRHGHVLQEMIPRMLEETIQKAVDPIFAPPAEAAPIEPLDRFELVDIPAPPLVRLSSSTLSSTHAAAPAARPSTNAGLKRAAQSVTLGRAFDNAATASPSLRRPTEMTTYQPGAEKQTIPSSAERATTSPQLPRQAADSPEVVAPPERASTSHRLEPPTSCRLSTSHRLEQPPATSPHATSPPATSQKTQMEEEAQLHRSLRSSAFREYLSARRHLDQYYDDEGSRLALEAALGPKGSGGGEQQRQRTFSPSSAASKLPELPPHSAASLGQAAASQRLGLLDEQRAFAAGLLRGCGSPRPRPANRRVWAHCGDEFVISHQRRATATGVWAFPQRAVLAQGIWPQGGVSVASAQPPSTAAGGSRQPRP